MSFITEEEYMFLLVDFWQIVLCIRSYINICWRFIMTLSIEDWANISIIFTAVFAASTLRLAKKRFLVPKVKCIKISLDLVKTKKSYKGNLYLQNYGDKEVFIKSIKVKFKENSLYNSNEVKSLKQSDDSNLKIEIEEINNYTFDKYFKKYKGKIIVEVIDSENEIIKQKFKISDLIFDYAFITEDKYIFINEKKQKRKWEKYNRNFRVEKEMLEMQKSYINLFRCEKINDKYLSSYYEEKVNNDSALIRILIEKQQFYQKLEWVINNVLEWEILNTYDKKYIKILEEWENFIEELMKLVEENFLEREKIIKNIFLDENFLFYYIEDYLFQVNQIDIDISEYNFIKIIISKIKLKILDRLDSLSI